METAFKICKNRMKYKSLIIIVISIAFMSMLSSCSTMLYGTSTKVTIKSEKEYVDSVNIIAFGPKEVVEYKNVSLPYEMDVKHDNLPLRVSINSKKEEYSSFTVNSKTKCKDLGQKMMAIGGGLGLGSALLMGEESGPIVIPSMAVMFAGMGFLKEVVVPEKNAYLTSSHPMNMEVEKSWLIDAVKDIYTLLDEKQYELAKVKSQWMLGKVVTGELYYLKGISNYNLGNQELALDDLQKALKHMDTDENPKIQAQIIALVEGIKRNHITPASNEYSQNINTLSDKPLYAGVYQISNRAYDIKKRIYTDRFDADELVNIEIYSDYIKYKGIIKYKLLEVSDGLRIYEGMSMENMTEQFLVDSKNFNMEKRQLYRYPYPIGNSLLIFKMEKTPFPANIDVSNINYNINGFYGEIDDTDINSQQETTKPAEKLKQYQQQVKDNLIRAVGSKCKACYGSGKCRACHGTKIAKGLGLEEYVCDICDKDGNCSVCHGTGLNSWAR